MEQEKRIGRWRTSLSSFWLLSTPQELSIRQPASTAAGTEARRGRSKDSYADRSRKSDKADRGRRVRTNHGPVKTGDGGRLFYF